MADHSTHESKQLSVIGLAASIVAIVFLRHLLQLKLVFIITKVKYITLFSL